MYTFELHIIICFLYSVRLNFSKTNQSEIKAKQKLQVSLIVGNRWQKGELSKLYKLGQIVKEILPMLH
jgi:hypothetical protein